MYIYKLFLKNNFPYFLRMFTEFERDAFRATFREYSEIEDIIARELPDDLTTFLSSEGHLKRVRDYAIFRRLPKVNMSETIILTYLLDSKTSLYDIILKWEEFLSPPVSYL